MLTPSLQVELVAADRLVWSGEATMVIARTTEGDVGILPSHAPMLSLLVDGVVDIQTAEGETWVAAVDAGFLSVANNRVSILSEHAEMSHEIDLEKARARPRAGASPRARTTTRREDAVRRAEARIRAAEKAPLIRRSSLRLGCARRTTWMERGGLDAAVAVAADAAGAAARPRPALRARPGRPPPLLSRNGGTFELSHRVRSGRAGRGWVLGLGRYSGDDLEWFRIFSLSPRPRHVWRRTSLRSSDAVTPRATSRCRSTPTT